MSTPCNVICFTIINYTNINKDKGRKLLNYLWKIAFVLLFAFLVFGFKYKILYNSGNSMMPTIEDRQMVVMERYWSGCYPDRMDIVVIKSSDDGDTLNKRIVGMPNEIFEVKEGMIYVNDKEIGDLYRTKTTAFSVKRMRIPKDCYYVVGDNRENSLCGIFHRREIWGIVIFF